MKVSSKKKVAYRKVCSHHLSLLDIRTSTYVICLTDCKIIFHLNKFIMQKNTFIIKAVETCMPLYKAEVFEWQRK